MLKNEDRKNTSTYDFIGEPAALLFKLKPDDSVMIGLQKKLTANFEITHPDHLNGVLAPMKIKQA